MQSIRSLITCIGSKGVALNFGSDGDTWKDFKKEGDKFCFVFLERLIWNVEKEIIGKKFTAA